MAVCFTAEWGQRSTAHVAQSVEHFLGKEEVSGSIPLVGSSNGARVPQENNEAARLGALPLPPTDLMPFLG
jgi:hypothetical protein